MAHADGPPGAQAICPQGVRYGLEGACTPAHRKPAEALATAAVTFLVLVASGVPALAATTRTWSLTSDFLSGSLSEVDANASTGGLRLAAQTTIGWAKSANNPVLGPGPAGSWDAAGLAGEDILYDNGTFKMWYDGCPVAIGYNCSIGYATSADGVAWTKYPGNPVLDGNGTSWDTTLGSMTVLIDGSGYRMWYGGNGPGSIQIGYATSPDGIRWKRYPGNPIIRPTAGTWDAGAVTGPVLLQGGPGLVLYLSGHPGNYDYAIGRATSQDGINWTMDPGNPLLSASAGWELPRIAAVAAEHTVLGYDLYYAGGLPADGIGLATSQDGRNWTREPSNPLLAPGPSGTWDNYALGDSCLVTTGSPLRLYYAGFDGTTGRIGFATYPVATTVYAHAGSWESPVIDSGWNLTVWQTLAWNATQGSGTNVGLAIRVGNSSTPDPSWSTSPALTSGPARLSLPRARYAQVAAVLVTANASQTPVVHDIELSYAGSEPPPTSLVPSNMPPWLFALGMQGLAIAIVVAIAVLVDVARRTPRRIPSTSASAWTCPSCGAVNPPRQGICGSCGRPAGPSQSHPR